MARRRTTQRRCGTCWPSTSTAPARSPGEYGLQFFYHNHDFEFSNRFNGRPTYDILLEETDPDLVKFELDLYWIVYGGESPVHYLLG